MKIAIFENDVTQVETAFKAVNLVYFNNTLSLEYFMSSQSLKPFEDIKKFDIAIIDIGLSVKSDLDGYGLIQKILEQPVKPEILILTGHSRIEESLKEKKLPSYPIITKPVTFKDIFEKLNPIIEKVKSKNSNPQ
jgi:DNA-binding NtrC family response regulator